MRLHYSIGLQLSLIRMNRCIVMQLTKLEIFISTLLVLYSNYYLIVLIKFDRLEWYNSQQSDTDYVKYTPK